MLGFGKELGEVSQFQLELKELRTDEGRPCAVFAASIGVAGGAGEYLDHRESGTDMDMRVPVSECRFLGRRQD